MVTFDVGSGSAGGTGDVRGRTGVTGVGPAPLPCAGARISGMWTMNIQDWGWSVVNWQQMMAAMAVLDTDY